jgi:hypothetical protein
MKVEDLLLKLVGELGRGGVNLPGGLAADCGCTCSCTCTGSGNGGCGCTCSCTCTGSSGLGGKASLPGELAVLRASLLRLIAQIEAQEKAGATQASGG